MKVSRRVPAHAALLTAVFIIGAIAADALPVPLQQESGAGAPASEPKTAPASALEPLARLVGEWRGQIRLLDGRVIDALNVFEWGLGGKTVQFRAYALAGGRKRLVYEGLFGWQPKEGRIVLREHSAFDSMVDGELEPDGDNLRFSWIESSRDRVVEYRETFRFPDDDSYVTEVYRKTDDGWERFTLENPFARQKPSQETAWQRVIRKEIRVAASPAKVWDAWTTTEGVKTFFAPEARVEAVVGGPFELYFAPGAPPGRRGSEGCKVHTVVPLKLLVFEWNAPHAVHTLRNAGVHTLVYLEFTELGPEETRVELSHIGWGAGEDWEKTYQYFDAAWSNVLGNLEKRFAEGPIDWEKLLAEREQRRRRAWGPQPTGARRRGGSCGVAAP